MMTREELAACYTVERDEKGQWMVVHQEEGIILHSLTYRAALAAREQEIDLDLEFVNEEERERRRKLIRLVAQRHRRLKQRRAREASR